MAELIAVKAPNQRGVGDSCVYHTTDERWTEGLVNHVFIKCQYRYYCRPLWNGGRSTYTAKRELRALLALKAAGVNVPVVVSYQETNDRAMLVTGAIANALPLDVALRTSPECERSILTATAWSIRQLHRAGWTHGALYPWHLLVRMEPYCQVFLVDLEKAKRNRRSRSDLRRLTRYLTLPKKTLVFFLEAYAKA